MAKAKPSPNPEIDKAVKTQLKRLNLPKDDEERVTDPETCVKIIAVAIKWEEACHKINARPDDDEFDPLDM